MAYQKVPRPSTVYHLTKKEHLDSILDDGVIRRFDDTECWFCESLDKMRAYMAQTVLCEGKSYYAVGGQLCRYPKFVPEDYVLLKLTPRGYEDNWYRWNQEIPPDSPKELARAAREFSLLKIGYRGDMAFKEPEVIDVPKFLSGEIVSHMLERKIEALNNKMLTLVNESVSSGDGIEAHESEFMTLSQEAELLKQRIAAIQESTAKDNGEQSRLEQIQAIISERESKCMEYDDSIVRQMVECIKVYPGGKLEIIFGGGYLVEESV